MKKWIMYELRVKTGPFLKKGWKKSNTIRCKNFFFLSCREGIRNYEKEKLEAYWNKVGMVEGRKEKGNRTKGKKLNEE